MSPFVLSTAFSIISSVLVLCFTGGTLQLVLLGFVFLLFFIVLGLGVSFIQMNFFLKAICRIQPGKMQVCLTFDDGPDPESTPLLLDLLGKMEIQATFFCIGEKVISHPELVNRMVREGHLIGNHTFRHKGYTNFFWGKLLDGEIQKTQKAIESASATTPKYFRPPMGLTNPHLKGALKKAGLTLVGWDIRSFDRKEKSPEAVIERILKSVWDGSIILLHDGLATPQILIALVEKLVLELKKKGYSFVTVDGISNRERREKW